MSALLVMQCTKVGGCRTTINSSKVFLYPQSD